MASGNSKHEPLELELPCAVGSVPRARWAASEYAEQVGADPDDVALAVSEAVTNAVVHAYRDEGPGESIVVRAAEDGEKLTVSVSDVGVGMSPNPGARGLGLGLPLIGRVADAVEIRNTTQGGTQLLMHFRLEEESRLAGP